MANGGNFAQLVDRRPTGVVLSPSQIEKWDLCKRRWALEYIGGIKPPPHPSAQLGTDVHTILEAWLMYSTPPNINTKAGKIAAKMIVNLPYPGTGVTERQFYLTTHNGISYTGKIDWSGIFHEWPTVVDHKTTGNLAYAKSAAQLHSDLQALTYTLAGCLGFGIDEIQLLWNYGTTKDRDPIVQPSRTKIRLPIAVEKFENIVEPYAAEIVYARQSRADPMSFPTTASACGAFGGCPHQSICNLSEKEKLRGIMTDAQNPTLASRLASFPQGGGFAPPGQQQPQFMPQQQPQFMPQQPQFVPPPVPPPTPGYVQQPQPPQTTGYVQQTGFMSPSNGATPGGRQQPVFTPPGNNGAPQQPQSFSFTPPGGAPQMPQQPPQAAFNPNLGPNPPESGNAAAALKPNAPVVGTGEEKPKRGRGRPKKSEGEADVAQEIAYSAPPNNREEKEVFMSGMRGMLSNPQWNGQQDQLLYAGNLAVEVFKARYPGNV
jgi:hypothetical protein